MIISKLKESDADEMFGILQHEEIFKYISTGKPPSSIQSLKNEYKILEKGVSLNGKHRCQYWIVRDSASNAIGFLELFYFPPYSADFAYVFTPSAWGKGMAYKSSLTLFNQLMEKSLTELYATVDPRNARSISLLQRLGFFNIQHSSYNNGHVEPDDLVYKKIMTIRQ